MQNLVDNKCAPEFSCYILLRYINTWQSRRIGLPEYYVGALKYVVLTIYEMVCVCVCVLGGGLARMRDKMLHWCSCQVYIGQS